MTRAVALFALAIALALGAAALWCHGGDEAREHPPDPKTVAVVRVELVNSAEGDLALVDEIRGGVHGLGVVALDNGLLVGRRDFASEGDRRRGLVRFVGAGNGTLWAVSHDLGLHGRDPRSGAVSVEREDLARANPALAAALLAGDGGSASYRLDLATGRLVISVGDRWVRIEPDGLVGEEVAPEALRLRSLGPPGYHALRRSVHLSGGSQIVLEKLGAEPGGRTRYDSLPTLVSPEGRRVRMSDRLKLVDPRFLYDGTSDEAITLAMPASLLVVQNQGRALSRLALTGFEVWRVGLSALLPGADDGGKARIDAAHLSGRLLVLHAGTHLVAVKATTGELIWVYPPL